MIKPFISGSIDRKSPEPVTPKNYTTFDGLDWEEFKPIILNWLHSETNPADIDILMVGEHYKKLVLDGKIEDVKKMCSFLYRYGYAVVCMYSNCILFTVLIVSC